MWNHLAPKDSCIICGRKCFVPESRQCVGSDKLLCDKWVENMKDAIVKQQIKNLQERLKVNLPPLNELIIVNRDGLYLGDGEYVYHTKTDTFFRCIIQGQNIPLLQSEIWVNVNKYIHSYYSQYNAELKDILKKRIFEEENKGEWSPHKRVDINISPEEFSEIEYEPVSGFIKSGLFDIKHALATDN
jgi:hypothetical protein